MSEKRTKQPIRPAQMLLEEKPINVADLLWAYLRYWPWFIICIGLALFGAFIYLKVNKPVYRAVASIIIEDEKGILEVARPMVLPIWVCWRV